MTEKLYYREPYKKEFKAEIIETVEEKDIWKVVLDKTCFYPEGGGQPADKGWINDIPVLDVRKKDDTVFHYLANDPGTGEVKGKIDWTWRSDYMQQHTGQHIISAALMNVGNYDTVSVHFGEKYSTIEIDVKDISEKDIIKVEKVANKAINRNLRIHFIWTTSDKIGEFPLRRPCNQEGEIRIIQIGDFDCVACSGLHFESTGAVGLVKAIGVEKIRGRVRTIWKIGERAYDDYRQKNNIIIALKTILSAKEDKIIQETEQLKENILKLEDRCEAFEAKVAENLAYSIYEAEKKKSVPQKTDCYVIVKLWDNEDNGIIKKVMQHLTARKNVLACFVNVYNSKLLYWSIGCSEEVDFYFTQIRKDLLQIIKGKGGGYHPLWQGIGVLSEKTEEFFQSFKKHALEFILKT
jgi:alanyl-tRNA synthetase